MKWLTAADAPSPVSVARRSSQLAAFVREVKAAVLHAQGEAAAAGLAVTGVRLEAQSTLETEVMGGSDPSVGLGAFFLDLARLSFHRQRTEMHDICFSLQPPHEQPPAEPAHGPLALQLAAAVRGVAGAAAVLCDESPAFRPVGPLATLTLNLGLDRGGTLQIVLGGMRDVQTTHSLVLTLEHLACPGEDGQPPV